MVASRHQSARLERFTTDARRVMVLCQDEAQKLRHNVLTPHHLALALMRLEEERDSGPLVFGVDRLALRQAIEAEAGDPMPTGPAGAPPFTPESKRLLGDALKEALQIGDNFIAPGHLLLALIKAGTPTALAEWVPVHEALQVVREQRNEAAAEMSGVGSRRTMHRLPGFVEVLRSAISRSARGTPAGSQHILLTLVARQDTLAGRILAELGVTEDKVRELIDKIGPEGTLDEPPRPDYEVRIGEHSLRIDDPQSREALQGILTEADLAERIRVAMDRRAKEAGN